VIVCLLKLSKCFSSSSCNWLGFCCEESIWFVEYILCGC